MTVHSRIGLPRTEEELLRSTMLFADVDMAAGVRRIDTVVMWLRFKGEPLWLRLPAGKLCGARLNSSREVVLSLPSPFQDIECSAGQRLTLFDLERLQAAVRCLGGTVGPPEVQK